MSPDTHSEEHEQEQDQKQEQEEQANETSGSSLNKKKLTQKNVLKKFGMALLRLKS